MSDKDAAFIDVADLRVGHYIYLDLGWMDHPFALSNFRIGTDAQITTIRGLGIERVRYSPEKSVFPDPTPTLPRYTDGEPLSAPRRPPLRTADAAPPVMSEALAEAEAERQERRVALSAQRTRLATCESQFNDAARGFKQIVDSVLSQPGTALARCDEIVGNMLDQMGGPNDETYVRLLSEKAGERTSLHSINVTIVSLLLARAVGCDAGQLRDIGIGAMLHDIGKLDLPDRIRWADRGLSTAEQALFRGHVEKGPALVARLGLSNDAKAIIAQHHERANGSGYPRQLSGDQIAQSARIVALVNEFDNLANPGNPATAVTPHEALALIYAQQRNAFDARVLSVFVRLMGVYPPGSVIELSTGHYAMVVSVNPSRPLRPLVIVHDPGVPASEALIFDLEAAPEIGIRRSLKPLQLPKAAYDYLSPRKRLCYFFERAADATESMASL